MMADRFSLLSMWGIIWFVIITIGTQFILISSRSLWSAISWTYPMFEIPTLLIKIEQLSSIPLSLRSLKMVEKNYGFWHWEKSAITYSVWIRFSQEAFIFANASSIFVLFRAIMHILKPKAANSSQNPNPMPSLPPVTTAHVFAPYRYA